MLPTLFALGACGGSSPSGPAAAHETTTSTASALSTTGVLYGGGPIVQPDIIPVYWGAFSQSDINSMQAYLNGFATYISGSTSPPGQEPTAAQYGVRGATIEAPVAVPTIPAMDGSGLGHTLKTGPENLVASMQQAGTLPAYGPERLFVVLLKNIQVDDIGSNTCAGHGPAMSTSGHWIALVPFDHTSCGTSTTEAQTATSHEILEAATDPDAASGWHGTADSGVNEVADACELGSFTTLSFGAVENIYDAQQNGICSAWTPEQRAQLSVVVQSSSTTVLDVFGLGGDHSIQHRRWTSSAGWQASWDNLGGTFTSPPVAVAGVGGFGTVDVFAQGTDNSFYHKSWNGSAWTPSLSSWDAPFSGNRFNGQPAVVSMAQGRIDVFGMGIDGAYYHQTWTSSAGWAPLELIGGTFNGPPTAISEGVGTDVVDLFGRGIDGSYYHKSYNGTSFSPAGPTGWDAPFTGHAFISEPAAASPALFQVDVVGQETDWSYYHEARTGSQGWLPLEALGGTFDGPPSVSAIDGQGGLEVVGQGTDGAYYDDQKINGSWSGITAVQGSGFGAAALAVPVLGDVNVFIEGTDHEAYFKTHAGTTWTPAGSNWNAIGGALH